MVFKSASEDIVKFLNQIIEKGFKNILLYGAGEVAEILLQTLSADLEISVIVLGVIDDDKQKQGKKLIHTKIISIDECKQIEHDGILISSFTNRNQIWKKLIYFGYDESKIINFFQI